MSFFGAAPSHSGSHKAEDSSGRPAKQPRPSGDVVQPRVDLDSPTDLSGDQGGRSGAGKGRALGQQHQQQQQQAGSRRAANSRGAARRQSKVTQVEDDEDDDEEGVSDSEEADEGEGIEDGSDEEAVAARAPKGRAAAKRKAAAEADEAADGAEEEAEGGDARGDAQAHAQGGELRVSPTGECTGSCTGGSPRCTLAPCQDASGVYAGIRSFLTRIFRRVFAHSAHLGIIILCLLVLRLSTPPTGNFAGTFGVRASPRRCGCPRWTRRPPAPAPSHPARKAWRGNSRACTWSTS